MKNLIIKYQRTVFLIILLFHIFILCLIQLVVWPEMLSYPYLLNKGYLLYKDIINPYPPLLPYLLKFYYGIFGLNFAALRLLSVLVVIITDCLLFLIVKKIFNPKYALLTLSIYILLQSSFEGNGIWFDLVITPLLILSYFLSYKLIFLKRKNHSFQNSFALGLVLSFAFLIKQTSALVILSITLLIICFKKYKSDQKILLIYLLGILTPIVVISFFIFNQGIFSDYLFWVYQYPFIHIKSPGFALLPTIKQWFILIILLIPSLITIVKYQSQASIKSLSYILIPALFFVFPRFAYFHLQPVLPFIAICFAFAFYQQSGKKQLLVSLILVTVLLTIYGYFLGKGVNKPPRFYDKKTLGIAKLLKEEYQGQGNLYFYNLSSEFYVLADLLPVKPWADTFPWYLEVPYLQEKIISELISSRTKYIVYRKFNQEGKYIPGSYIPVLIDRYIELNYLPFEKIDDDIYILKKQNL